MRFMTLEEAIEHFTVQVHNNMNSPGVKREGVRRGVKAALTHSMVFELWRLSPLVAEDGHVILKDGKLTKEIV